MDPSFGQQQQPGGRQQQQNPVMKIAQLLRQPSVQQELGLDETQLKAAATGLRETAQRLQREMQGVAMASPGERGEKIAELRGSLERDVDRLLGEAASERAAARFRQIRLQAQGIQGLASPTVVAALALTESQSATIREIASAGRQSAQAAMQAARQSGGGPEARKQVRELRERTKEQALAALDPEQRRRWDELVGEPFELPVEAMEGQGPGMPGGMGMGPPGMQGRRGMGPGPRRQETFGADGGGFDDFGTDEDLF